MPLLLQQVQLHAIKAFRPPSIGIPSINTSVLFELDLKTLGTSSVHTSILWAGIAEGPAIVQVP